jgi:hypothetical protein
VSFVVVVGALGVRQNLLLMINKEPLFIISSRFFGLRVSECGRFRGKAESAADDK